MKSALSPVLLWTLLLLVLPLACQPGESSLIIPKPASAPPAADVSRAFALDWVAPSTVPTTGGTPITLAGTQFENGMSVFINGIESMLTVVRSGTQAQALTPPLLGKMGKVSVSIRKANGESLTRSDLLSYYTENISFAERHRVGNGSTTVIVADLNGDGYPEAITTNIGTHDVSVLPGLVDGSFGQAVSYPVGQDPRSVAVGDVNQDGLPDLVVGNLSNRTLSILFARKEGGFAPAQNVSLSTDVYGVAIHDFDFDGVSDILTVNSDQNTVSVHRGKGDGSLRSPVTFAAGTAPVAVRLEDVNRDTMIDVVVANQSGRSVTVLLGNQTTMFSGAITSTTNGLSGTLALCDFNRDGTPDVVTASALSPTVAVAMGKGDGSFGAPTLLTAGSPVFSVGCADFDGDGFKDIVATCAAINTVSIFCGNGAGAFTVQKHISLPGVPSSIATTDINRDGLPDGIITTYTGNRLFTMRGVTYGNPYIINSDIILGSLPGRALLADLDGDGRKDIVTSLKNHSEIESVYGATGGTFSDRWWISTGISLPSFTLADWYNNSLPAILVPSDETGIVSFSSLSDRSINYSGKIPYQYNDTALAVAQIEASDLNKDGLIDIVITGAEGIHVYLRNSSGGLSAPLFFSTATDVSTNVSMFQLSDLNGDSIVDAVVTDYLGKFSTMMGVGDGTFLTPVFTQTDPNPSRFVIADLDLDGRADLVVCHDSTSQLSYLRGLASGTFSLSFSIKTVGNCSALTLGDVNGDGKQDIAFFEKGINKLSDSGIGILKNNGLGTFDPVIRYYQETGVSALFITDTNDDGRNDLVITNEPLHYVRILYNQSQ